MLLNECLACDIDYLFSQFVINQLIVQQAKASVNKDAQTSRQNHITCPMFDFGIESEKLSNNRLVYSQRQELDAECAQRPPLILFKNTCGLFFLKKLSYFFEFATAQQEQEFIKAVQLVTPPLQESLQDNLIQFSRDTDKQQLISTNTLFTEFKQ